MSSRIGLALIFFLSLSTTSLEAQYRSHHRNSSYHRHATAAIIAKTKPATMAAAHQNQEAQQLRNVIENAKLIVAQGELRLRQLGAKPLASKYGKR